MHVSGHGKSSQFFVQLLVAVYKLKSLSVNVSLNVPCPSSFTKAESVSVLMVMSMLVSFVLSFFPRDVLDGILNLIGSVSEGFPSYSWS